MPRTHAHNFLTGIAIVGLTFGLGGCSGDLFDPPSTAGTSATPIAVNDTSTLPPPPETQPVEGSGNAVQIAQRLPVAEPHAPSKYDRIGQFGSSWTDNNTIPVWGDNRCRTNGDVYNRDLVGQTHTRGCQPTSGVLNDPYTGTQIEYVGGRQKTYPINVDHLVPLSLAWMHGAGTWNQQRRINFANDPRNLVASDAAANRTKSDSGPSEWMPPNKSVWCAYAAGQTAVLSEYELTVSADDKTTLIEVLRGCPADQQLPTLEYSLAAAPVK